MQESEFTQIWKQYEPFVKAIVELFHPFVEAAVHDLEQGKVVALYHTISQRKVGDPSPVKELNIKTKDFPPYFTPYYKENWDGGPLKCTSITLFNKKGMAVGLICFNVDVSYFYEGQRILDAFLTIKDEAKNPIEIFGDFENQATALMQRYVDEKQLHINRLNRDQKKELVQFLYKKGIFNFKKAAPFIAKKLNSSRASIYNYIKQLE